VKTTRYTDVLAVLRKGTNNASSRLDLFDRGTIIFNKSVRELCLRRNIHIVCLLHPSDVWVKLFDLQRTLWSDDLATFQAVYNIASMQKSLPCCLPIIVTRHGVAEIDRIIDRRIEASQQFISGFNSPHWVGDDMIAMPRPDPIGAINSAPWRLALTQCIESAVAPRLHGQVDCQVYNGNNAINCVCGGNCRRDCLCTCVPVCRIGYTGVCGGGLACGQVLCPCTCTGHH
jgi:hypothetical protein